MLDIKPSPMQIGSNRSPEGVRITFQLFVNMSANLGRVSLMDSSPLCVNPLSDLREAIYFFTSPKLLIWLDSLCMPSKQGVAGSNPVSRSIFKRELPPPPKNGFRHHRQRYLVATNCLTGINDFHKLASDSLPRFAIALQQSRKRSSKPRK